MCRRGLILLLLVSACQHEPTATELLQRGNRQLALGSVDQTHRATATFEQALTRTTDPALQASIYLRLGKAQVNVNQDGYLETYKKAQALAEKAGDKALALEARVHVAGASDEPAEPVLKQIIAEAQAAGARHAELTASSVLCSVISNLSRYTETISVCTHALELVRATPDPELEANIEFRLGGTYFSLGDMDRSLPHLERELALAREHHLGLEEGRALVALGGAYMWAVKDRTRALIYYSASAAQYNLLGHGRTSKGLAARMNMGRAQLFLSDYFASVDTISAAVADGRVALRAGTLSERTLLDMLLALGPSASKAGKLDLAREVYAEAITMARPLADKHPYHSAVVESARLALRERRWHDAAQGIDEVIDAVAAQQSDITDERLRFSYDQALRNVTAVLLEARVGEEDLNAAFEVSERMRSRRLLGALGSETFVDGKGAQALLDADTTLVEYTFADTWLYAFVVDQRSVRIVSLGNGLELGLLAKAWYDQAAAFPTPPELEAMTRRLADKILAPLVPLLHGRRLVIVPDKGLLSVAFAALPLPDGKPLIERFELVHLASASVLRAQREHRDARPRPTRELAILADPIFDKSDERVGGAPPPAARLAMRAATAPIVEGGPADVPRLPSTHAEAESIAALLPPGKAFVAEGAAATRATALGPEVAGARYVHFATHALLDNVDPSRTGLVFTQLDPAGNPIDGFVRVADIEKAPLAAEMVVLSACRTAIGKSFDGEGFVGLTRAFVRARVPRVVSSLWQIDDEATATLMARFYRGFLSDGLSPPAALRRAQLEAGVNRGRAMRLWAGVAFYGDWR